MLKTQVLFPALCPSLSDAIKSRHCPEWVKAARCGVTDCIHFTWMNGHLKTGSSAHGLRRTGLLLDSGTPKALWAAGWVDRQWRRTNKKKKKKGKIYINNGPANHLPASTWGMPDGRLFRARGPTSWVFQRGREWMLSQRAEGEKHAVPGCKSEAVTKSFKYGLLRGQYHDTAPAMLGSQMNATLNPSYPTANPVPCYCAWKSRGRWPEYLGLRHPYGRSRWISMLLEQYGLLLPQSLWPLKEWTSR